MCFSFFFLKLKKKNTKIFPQIHDCFRFNLYERYPIWFSDLTNNFYARIRCRYVVRVRHCNLNKLPFCFVFISTNCHIYGILKTQNWSLHKMKVGCNVITTQNNLWFKKTDKKKGKEIVHLPHSGLDQPPILLYLVVLWLTGGLFFCKRTLFKMNKLLRKNESDRVETRQLEVWTKQARFVRRNVIEIIVNWNSNAN